MRPRHVPSVPIGKYGPEPRSISQTEKAVEREQIRSNEQILPTPAVAIVVKYQIESICIKK